MLTDMIIQRHIIVGDASSRETQPIVHQDTITSISTSFSLQPLLYPQLLEDYLASKGHSRNHEEKGIGIKGERGKGKIEERMSHSRV